MPVYEEFRDIMEYYYEEPETEGGLPFLFRIHRAGCELLNEHFNVERDEDYHYYSLHIVFEGYGFLHIGDRDYFLKAGDMFLLTPNQAHHYRNHSSSVLGLLWVEFSGYGCQELFSRVRSNKIFTLQNVSDQKLRVHMAGILSYMKQGSVPNPYEISQKTYCLIMYLLEIMDHVETQQGTGVFYEALCYIDKNLKEPLKVRDISDHLHISESHLSRVFKKNIGTSVVKYVTLKKLEYACCLLVTSEMSCEEISEHLNFYDNSYFYKVFKKNLGLTPAEYRKNTKDKKL